MYHTKALYQAVYKRSSLNQDGDDDNDGDDYDGNDNDKNNEDDGNGIVQNFVCKDSDPWPQIRHCNAKHSTGRHLGIS